MRFYELAIAYDEGNYDVTFEVAYYMQSQNQFSKARTYYEKALTQTGQPDQKSAILNPSSINILRCRRIDQSNSWGAPIQ